MSNEPKHPQASLSPSQLLTLALLFALKGVGNRACYRWIRRDDLALFPKLPPRTRRFRLFAVHPIWADRLLADPTILAVADRSGIELLHPMRAGRRPQQIGNKGQANHRWIVGGKLADSVNQGGLVVAWACASANVDEASLPPLLAPFDGTLVVGVDTPFPAKAGHPPHLKISPRGTWNVRRVIETVLSMLTTVCHCKKVSHRGWTYVQARLAFTMARFNLLVPWHGLQPDADGYIQLSIAKFSL
jgi:hypothetical protein